MPRLGEGRAPAEPSSPGQHDRYRRILRTAAVHGAIHGFDRVQMTDVARDADVAIGTLYRYLPSKAAMFTALLRSQIDRLESVTMVRRPGQPRAEAVAEVLLEAGRQLMRRPLLAHAMLQSNNAAVAGEIPSSSAATAFGDLLLRVADLEEPTAHDRRLVRLVEQAWYGVLISQLNGLIDADDTEFDTRLLCRILLADLGASRTSGSRSSGSARGPAPRSP